MQAAPLQHSCQVAEAQQDEPAKGLMMSDYRGHDRPYPIWFPYLLVAMFLVGATIYIAARGSDRAPASGQNQDDMSMARYKTSIASKRRA